MTELKAATCWRSGYISIQRIFWYECFWCWCFKFAIDGCSWVLWMFCCKMNELGFQTVALNMCLIRSSSWADRIRWSCFQTTETVIKCVVFYTRLFSSSGKVPVKETHPVKERMYHFFTWTVAGQKIKNILFVDDYFPIEKPILMLQWVIYLWNI